MVDKPASAKPDEVRSAGRKGWRVISRRKLGLGASASERRLLGEIYEFSSELDRHARHDGGHEPSWLQSARELAAKAGRAVEDGDLATGFACMLAARRETVWGYSPGEIHAERLALQAEASEDKIRGWRRTAITALIAEMGKDDTHLLVQFGRLAAPSTQHIEQILRGSSADKQADIALHLERSGIEKESASKLAALIVQMSGPVADVSGLVQTISTLMHDPVVDRVLLHEAMAVRDEGYQNSYRKLERLQWQLLILGMALVAIVAAILIVVITMPLALTNNDAFGGRILSYVGLFGALGGCLSAIQSLSRGTSSLRIPEQLVLGATTLVRPLFGAAAAIAVYAFLRSGLLTVASNSNAGVLATSFVAGFSERLVVNAAGLVSKSRAPTT